MFLSRFFPPPVSLGRGKQDAAGILRRVWVRTAWARSSWSRRFMFAAAIVLWPFLVLVAAMKLTSRLGGRVKRETGKSLMRQFAEQVRVGLCHQLTPRHYYMFELFRDDLGKRAREYLTRAQTKSTLFGLLVDRSRWIDSHPPFSNKEHFSALCARHGLRSVPTIATAYAGEVRLLPEQATHLPRRDLFLKPRSLRGGFGTESWSYRDGYYCRGDEKLDEQGLMRRLADLSRAHKYLVQPRLSPCHHLADLSFGVLTTMRIMTCMDLQGRVAATNAVFRMPRRQGVIVDNFHAGGIGAPIDMATGRLGPATAMGLRPDSAWHRRHPLNGAQIEGRQVPFWAETIDLACRAHLAFSDRPFVGWDVGLLDDGPCLIEGNGRPDLDIIQRAQLEPLGNAPFGRILAQQICRRLGLACDL